MHHYKHHIGDFDAATRHLTRCERSVYRDMIERYYDQEGPFLLGDLPRIKRRCMIVSDEERAAFDLVLDEFFHLDGDAWHHDRCDRVLAEYRESQSCADERREHGAERKARHRARRAELFDSLRSVGVVPDFNTDIKALEALVRQHVPTLSHGTGQGQDADGTTKPITNNHKPIISPLPPNALGGVNKSPRVVGKSFPSEFGLDSASADGLSEGVKAVARGLRDELKVDWTLDTLRHHLAQFRAHYGSKSGRAGRSANWLLAWEMWCRRAMCYQPAADPVRRDVQAAAARGKARDSPPGSGRGRWDATPDSIAATARERGIEARPGETIGMLRERVALAMAAPRVAMAETVEG